MGIRGSLELFAKKFNYKLLNNEMFVFIDEIQEIKGWQKDIKFLYDNSKIQFVVTGSSSLILKNDTSKLTGRFILQHILPLSYPEFLKFKKAKHSADLLNEYVKYGGYPEYVLNGSQVYLQQAVESTLYRELLDIYGIRNPIVLKDILGLLADKITTPVSANKIAKDLKMDDKTVKFYLDYLKSVYLIYPVYLYGRSNKISKGSLPKYYFNDNGVLNLFGIRQRIGHLVENAVFIELLRNQDSELTNIFYDIEDGQEVDFRVREQLYEVKTKGLTPIEMAKYELFDRKIKLITTEDFQASFVPNVEIVKFEELMKVHTDSRSYKLPKGFRQKFARIDPVKYQRKIRKEY